MKTLRTTLATLTLITVITCSSAFANTGILVAGATDSGTTTQCTETTVTVDSGILVAGFTGILVAGLTGILVAGASGETQTDCGILVAG